MIKTELLPLYKIPRQFWLWFILAQLSFLTTIGLPYQGEEAVYTITSMEMVVNHEWGVPTQYGENYARPPLFNWFIIPLAYGLGWDHILIASRIVAAMATFLTSILLIWFVQKLFKNRTFSLFCALVYMSSDVLYRRGWLAYADPLFSLFVFGAIASLWIAVQERRCHLFWLAGLGLIASFLTKALTGYIFYGAAIIVLWSRQPATRTLLLKPQSLCAHGIALLFPIVWNIYISEGAHAGGMLYALIAKWNLVSVREYFLKLTLYPLETFVRTLPIGLLLLYFLLKRIVKKQPLAPLFDYQVMTGAWIFGLNYLPYWLAPESHIRYIMPLYPFLALMFTSLLWKLGEAKIKIVFVWLAVAIALRYVIGFWGFPYYEKHYRGDYQAVAKDILTITHNQPLYADDYSATGLSVVANLDVITMPKSILKKPDPNWKEGFLISNTKDVDNTKISKEYHLGNHPLYLLCRGSACK